MRTVVLMSHAGFRLWLDMLDEALRDCLELDPGNATLLAQQEVSRKLRAGEVLEPPDFKVMGWKAPTPEALKIAPISSAFDHWPLRREPLREPDRLRAVIAEAHRLNPLSKTLADEAAREELLVGPPAVVKPIRE